METKVCTGCGEEKALTEYYYRTSHTGKLLYQSACKVCMKARSKENAKVKSTVHNEFCLHCGELLKDTRSFYCGKACASKAQHDSPPIEVECSICGNKVQRKRSHALREAKRVFCSNECRDTFYREEGRGLLTCEWCGKTIDVPAYRKKQGRFCSRECDGAWRSENIVGDKHPCWTDGRAQADQAARQGKEVKAWALAVIKRDNFTCFECGQVGGVIHAHHMYRWKHYPDLRLDLDNGITLCKRCHAKYTYQERQEDKREYHERKKAN